MMMRSGIVLCSLNLNGTKVKKELKAQQAMNVTHGSQLPEMLAQRCRYGYKINTMVYQFRNQATADRYNVVGLIVMNANAI